MNPNALKAFLVLALAGPVLAGQIDAPVSGDFSSAGPTGAIGTSLGAPIPLQMTVPTLSGALSPAALTLTPSPVIAAAVPIVKAPALASNLKQAASIGEKREEKSSETGYAEGRAKFDQSALLSGSAAPAVEGTWSNVKSALLLKPVPGGVLSVPPVNRGLRERLSDTAELGVYAGLWQILSSLLFLIAGAHAAYPVLAGALWALGGAELIKQLGLLRSVVVGGWQSSHDQKMRTDYGTGKLKDIRGRGYGSDRYDITLPGPVTTRERNVIDGAAVLSGLPWIVTAGPAAVGLYLLSAVSVLYLRRVVQRSRPQPKTATAEDAVFERDR